MSGRRAWKTFILYVKILLLHVRNERHGNTIAKYRIFIGRRKIIFWALLLLAKLVLVYLLFYTFWWMIDITSKTLFPLPPLDHNLEHFRRNRSLAHYLDNIQVLIEPSSTPCTHVDEIPVIILVTSAPQNYNAREAIRVTWAKYQPTYFILGVNDKETDELLADNYLEAKQYSDMIVYDFRDHYQNLTLKTALIMQWTLRRCPQAKYLMKTDDDVLVNPWTLGTVLNENRDIKLLGYKYNDTTLHRDEYNKWYIPRWLYLTDGVPQFLAGTGYIINGDYLQVILDKALKVPMINLEDIFFSYLVAHRNLGLTLNHDRRFNPYRPFFGIGCIYWRLASSHSFTPEEIISAWRKVKSIANTNRKGCKFINFFLDYEFFFY